MSPKEINQQSIISFLAALGIYPKHRYKGYYMYKSVINPGQKTGSLKVSSRNLWIDYSQDNCGGTLIDLILLIFPNLTVKDIVRKFSNGDFSFHQLDCLPQPNQEKVEGIKILEQDIIQNHPTLCNYLRRDRCIDIELASRYLSAFQYEVRGRKYWNLGTENNAGGYTLFNRGFKGCTKQSFTVFQNSNTTSQIYFEGILDFLSFLMLYPDQEYLHDFYILNSVNNLNKLLHTVPFKSHIIAGLDNDEAGELATKKIKEEAANRGIKFSDIRKRYLEYKDLNEFLTLKNK